MLMTRQYPIGIQTFSEIIREGYVYVDKTDLVWQLAHYAKYIFLSRPRRFGKSLLSSTLESYFKGERELFEGLKLMGLEQEWTAYPTLRLDLSSARHMPPKDVRQELENILAPYEREYGENPKETTPGMRLGGLIDRAYEQTGRQVVVIIDEYDSPLLDVLHDDGRLAEMREIMQEFYQRLKQREAKIKFCFITGITKFSQLSIFSTINNIVNVTMDTTFAAICGITEEELTTVLRQDTERLASVNGKSYEEMHTMLKLRYDGYRFCEDSPEIYNPYSLLNAFLQRKVQNYWFSTGTPTFLIHQLQHYKTDITSLEHLEVPSSAFDQPTENMKDALPLLYQSGYLTIKGYDREGEIYTLSMPNLEVRIGYSKGLMPIYTGLDDAAVQSGFALKFWRALKQGDVEMAMREMQAYMAGIPYVEGFKKKLEEAATKEGFYEYTLYLIFSMLNVYVKTQVKCAGGRVDMVVWMPDTTYVFEMKVSGTAAEALAQIDEKSYALPYAAGDKPVVKVGVRFDAETRVPQEWVVETSQRV
ncbi:MAG: ATP-binding protein [Prevotella sp.]|nr:ATP-binding protein [Prevotella sp.]